MSPRLLLGSDRPLSDALGIVWVTIAGWAMGTTALSYFLPNGTLALLFCGLAPGLLSGGAAWFGTRGRGIPTRAMRTMVGSLMAALLCLPLTSLASVMMGGARRDISAVAWFMVMTIVGAFIAVLLGLLFGTIYAIALSLLTALQRRVPSRSDLDLALLAGGIGLVFVGIACLTFSVGLSAPLVGSVVKRATTAPLLTVGLGLIGALIGARYLARKWFVVRAIRGAIADWAVVPASDIADAESLPRLFAFGSAETVLVRREATDEGPFRSGEASTPIARC